MGRCSNHDLYWSTSRHRFLLWHSSTYHYGWGCYRVRLLLGPDLDNVPTIPLERFLHDWRELCWEVHSTVLMGNPIDKQKLGWKQIQLACFFGRRPLHGPTYPENPYVLGALGFKHSGWLKYGPNSNPKPQVLRDPEHWHESCRWYVRWHHGLYRKHQWWRISLWQPHFWIRLGPNWRYSNWLFHNIRLSIWSLCQHSRLR